MFTPSFKTKILFIVAVLLFSISAIGTAKAQKDTPDFETLSYELARLDHLYFVGADGREIGFDSENAENLGVSNESIKIAEETAALTNELISAAIENAESKGVKNIEIISIENVDIDAWKYPSLMAYNSMDKGETGKLFFAPDSPQSVCGSMTNPLPTASGSWNTKGPYASKNAAETQLMNWGYYRAWWVPGGNWTRNQTYKPETCKTNNYRDESSLPYKNNNNQKWYFNEQNYTGSMPGEPNPVMSSWPGNWPYLTWPAYVAWWHVIYTP